MGVRSQHTTPWVRAPRNHRECGGTADEASAMRGEYVWQNFIYSKSAAPASVNVVNRNRVAPASVQETVSCIVRVVRSFIHSHQFIHPQSSTRKLSKKDGGQGKSLVPPHTRGSVFLSFSHINRRKIWPSFRRRRSRRPMGQGLTPALRSGSRFRIQVLGFRV